MSSVACVDLDLALAEVARRPPPAGIAPRLREEALALVAQQQLAAPRYVARSHEVTGVTGPRFGFASGGIDLPGLAPHAQGVAAVSAVVCTLGGALESRVSELCRERQLSRALALDTVGNELLIHLAGQAVSEVGAAARHRGCLSGIPLTPGGCGLALDQQERVVALADGARVGVAVSSGGMLFPVKSRSLVIGVGEGMPAQSWRRCESCESCNSRRTCIYRDR